MDWSLHRLETWHSSQGAFQWTPIGNMIAWICTTVHQGCGRMLNSAWRVVGSLQQGLVMWHFLREGEHMEVIVPTPWICIAVKRGHGPGLSSAWRALILQLHRSVTWLSSRGAFRTQTLISHGLMCTTTPLIFSPPPLRLEYRQCPSRLPHLTALLARPLCLPLSLSLQHGLFRPAEQSLSPTPPVFLPHPSRPLH